jgi:MoaA/NifB/PqqE/SkfB family radical SAM enzyme
MDQSNLSLDRFTEFLELFPEIQHLELQGEGEPLINPDFFEMIDLATCRGIHISFITNGSFLHAHIQQILNSKIRSIRVSLETANPEKFQKIRGGSFPVVEAGIRQLLSERNRLGLSQPSVGFALTVLASTVDDVPEIYDLYQRLGMDGAIAIQSLNPMPQYAEVYDDQISSEYLRTDQKQRLQDYMTSKIAQEIWFKKSPHHHFYDELFCPRPVDIAQGKLASCPWLDSGLNLDRHGRLTPCCMVKGESWSFGTLGEITREEILESRAHLATELAQGVIPTPCHDCHIAKMIIAA